MVAVDRTTYSQAAYCFDPRISSQGNWLHDFGVLWRRQAQDRFSIAVAIAQRQEAVPKVAGRGDHQCPVPKGDCAQTNIIAKQAELTNARLGQRCGRYGAVDPAFSAECTGQR